MEDHHLKLMEQWTHLQLMLAMGQQGLTIIDQEEGNTHHGQMLTSYFIWIMAHLDSDAIIVIFGGLLQHRQVL